MKVSQNIHSVILELEDRQKHCYGNTIWSSLNKGKYIDVPDVSTETMLFIRSHTLKVAIKR